jgi:hypothetical protein
MRLSALIIAFVHATAATALYAPDELFVIPWGEGRSEFIAYEQREIDPGTPEDSADDYYDGGSGPSWAFVDYYGNLIPISPLDYQFKGFDPQGNLIFDFSGGSPDFVEGMFRGTLDKMYVDSGKHIYLTTAWPLPYVPKIGYEDGTVDSLSPFDMNPDEPIRDLNWTYDSKIMFFSDSLGWITVDGDQSSPGGTWGVKLADGRNYGARYINADTVEIYSSVNPDIWGHGSDLDTNVFSLGVQNLVHVEVLNGMEPTHLYLLLWYFEDFSYYEVWQFDLQYTIADKVIPPAEPAYYASIPKPFITSDGEIYEFRCLPDGLHVIRWSKE